MKKIEFLISGLIFSLIIFFFPGCIKDHMVVEITNSETYDSSYVYFTGTVNDLVTRTGVSALSQNRYVEIYTYSNNEYYNNTSYITNSPGVLTPTDNQNLLLFNGIYSFYMVSVGNKSQYPPNFNTNNIIGDLQNGIDYLSYNVIAQNIRYNTNIPIVFNHCCTQIVVDFIPKKDNSGKPELTIDSVRYVTITPSNPSGITMNLFTGQITASKSIVNSKIEMPNNELTCQQIILPLDYNGNLTVEFQAFINGSTNPIAYKAELSTVNGKLAAGLSYNYEIEMQQNGNTIAYYVNVYDWTIIDEFGRPLTPKLKM